MAVHNKNKNSNKKKIAQKLLSGAINALPFKKRFYPTLNIKTDEELGLNYNCIAFLKTEEDKRSWNWDKAF